MWKFCHTDPKASNPEHLPEAQKGLMQCRYLWGTASVLFSKFELECSKMHGIWWTCSQRSKKVLLGFYIAEQKALDEVWTPTEDIFVCVYTCRWELCINVQKTLNKNCFKNLRRLKQLALHLTIKLLQTSKSIVLLHTHKKSESLFLKHVYPHSALYLANVYIHCNHRSCYSTVVKTHT